MEGVCCTSDEGQENGVDCKCEEETTQDQKIEEGRTEEGENGWKKVRVQREEPVGIEEDEERGLEKDKEGVTEEGETEEGETVEGRVENREPAGCGQEVSEEDNNRESTERESDAMQVEEKHTREDSLATKVYDCVCYATLLLLLLQIRVSLQKRWLNASVILCW